MFRILPETPDDSFEVEMLYDLAFAPGRTALSSYQLREGVDPIAELGTIVRDEFDAVAGAIRYWPVRIGEAESPALLLGPIAIHPTRQGEGLGAALMMHTLELAREIGWERVVLVGDEPYYRRFGFSEHVAERVKADEFYARQEVRNAEKLPANPNAKVTIIGYTGKATYVDQIITSLKTVFMGFTIASLVALPIGIVCGLSKTFMSAVNPLVQIFKPVSPLAWLPIVTMIVSAVYVTNDGFFAKSFIISAITVSLCSLWATLINTALGVASVSTDYINVAKVLQLSPLKKTFKVLLPATLPLIFTGLRISLGVGWMVLIAAEMLAQNPGLGKFVWDEFQNGSSQSLARIMVAVFTVGIIGFILDRIMVELQKLVSFSKAAA
jgi:nitrate/nitrite transport system permease protein